MENGKWDGSLFWKRGRFSFPLFVFIELIQQKLKNILNLFNKNVIIRIKIHIITIGENRDGCKIKFINNESLVE